ncbi:MAG: helix-turn-helix transcriptional regulator [Treponema sp.]|nr:helix-turn-helix transcriptional regulator [Treponema sp.]
MTVRETFRNNLKFYRKQKGLTQEQLSEVIGYGGTYITEIESRHKFPKPETLDIIAKKLEIEPYQLFKPLETEKSVKKDLELENKTIENKNGEEFSKKLSAIETEIFDIFRRYAT